jgi:hypothetical protein
MCKNRNMKGFDMEKQDITLCLVLTQHWYDETESGAKTTEYRTMSLHWRRLIWERRDQITHVRFQRAFGKNAPKMTFKVSKIDAGFCPIDGWDGVYYRIHFGDEK